MPKSSVLALLFFVIGSGWAAAHEIRPAIADAHIQGQVMTMDIEVAVEGLIVGIDLGQVTDTNDSPLSDQYDLHRAMDPAALEEALRSAWPQIAPGITIESDGQRAVPELIQVQVPDVGDIDLPRDSRITLTAQLPPGDAPVVAGWQASFGPLILRQVGEGDELYSGYLTEGALSDPLPRTGVAEVPQWKEFLRYIILGFEHIIPKGLDHILFVLGLFFYSSRMRPLFLQVTLFTFAHTCTLALATLDLVSIPPEIVEPLIAASIVFVALENILGIRLGLQRSTVVFLFGLLHGLGFASVLGEVGLDPSRLITGLIGFNVGVEFGQMTVLAVAFLAVGLKWRNEEWYMVRIAKPASVAIALVGAYWLWERTLG